MNTMQKLRKQTSQPKSKIWNLNLKLSHDQFQFKSHCQDQSAYQNRDHDTIGAEKIEKTLINVILRI